MTNQLIAVLEKIISPDKNELTMAKTYLEQAALSNLPEFLKALSEILVRTEYSEVARMAAGLQLKNHLTSKDPITKREYTERWLLFMPDVREYIKERIVGALGTEKTRPSSAAQCVAAVAVAELPAGHWNMLIQTLLAKVVSDTSEMEREATLEAIGYICQDIPAEVLEGQSNQILTAIVHGMRKAEPSNHVRLAATNALLNSLEFTKNNFDSANERNYIMEVVCEATQCPDTQICVAALQCLVKILSLYYQHMEPYMAQALFPITIEAMKSDNVQVSLQGIEFWSNVCDEEIDLDIEQQEAQETGNTPVRVSKHYARGALQYLAPVLMKKMTNQEEFDDEDDWNPCKAAGVCLLLLATCCENDIVPHVLPFIKDNIKSEDWRYRDAALMVFGSIISGIDEDNLKPLVEQAMATLVELMYDCSVIVRDTAAWTFGRICEIIPQAIIESPFFRKILEALLRGLKEVPRVAANVCWALSGLSEAAYEAVSNHPDTPDSFALSEFFDYIVQCLLDTTDRPDGGQANLRSAAYEALMELIKNSPKDCYVTVQKTTMVILGRLNQVLQMEEHLANNTDLQHYNDLQSLLCGTLQALLRKVSPEDAPKISDAIMNALITMFQSKSCQVGSVQEDALMAVSVLVELLGEKFIKYMEAFKRFLYIGLKNHQEYQVCCVAVGLTGDICRGLKHEILPYCDEIMTFLLENVSNPSLHRSVKPQILAVFGDIAISIGAGFQKYLPLVLQILSHASQVHVDVNDYDMVEYLNELRESVLESYTGIIQGLKGSDQKPHAEIMLMESQLHLIVKFLMTIAEDPNTTDTIIASSVGLIGDLCVGFGPNLLSLIESASINRLLMEGKKSKVQRTKAMTTWTQKQIKNLQKQQQQHQITAPDIEKVARHQKQNRSEEEDEKEEDSTASTVVEQSSVLMKKKES